MIKAIDVPTKVQEVQMFAVLVNYYRYMWLIKKRTHIESNTFVAMKNTVGRDILLSYPNFSKTFIIHIYASKTQLGGIICQNGNPIAFYSHKSNPAQINYITTEK